MPDAKFFIIGDGKDKYYQSIRTMVKKERLDPFIIFTGWRNDIINVIADLDILIQATTSFPEGFGLTIIEAMALGKPVVASNIPGPADIIVDKKTGFLVPSKDPQILADRIINLLNNRKLAEVMGINGRKRVSELFDIKKNVRQIESIYEKVIDIY